MSDPYFFYVLGAYAATAVILGWLVWSTYRANAWMRTELEDAERHRK